LKGEKQHKKEGEKMSEHDNNMRGVLFKNDKDGNDKRPDYKGTCEIDGVPFKMSAWVQTSKNDGKKYMSIRFEHKEQTPVAASATESDDDTGLPF
jgi:uncharacterized protein (DUF736 family)